MTAFRVLESLLSAKAGTADGGDDKLVVTLHFTAVLDGATDGSGATYGVSAQPGLSLRLAHGLLKR